MATSKELLKQYKTKLIKLTYNKYFLRIARKELSLLKGLKNELLIIKPHL